MQVNYSPFFIVYPELRSARHMVESDTTLACHALQLLAQLIEVRIAGNVHLVLQELRGF